MSRPNRHLRYLDRSPCGCARTPDLDRAQTRSGLAVDARPQRQSLVSDDAALSAKNLGRLGPRISGNRRGGGGGDRRREIRASAVALSPLQPTDAEQSIRNAPYGTKVQFPR